MSWWDDWGETAFNIVTGGIYGAAKAGGQAAADAMRQAEEEAKQREIEALKEKQKGIQSGLNLGAGAGFPSFPGIAPGMVGTVPKFPGVTLPSPGTGGDGRSDCCCERFQLEDGLLLDKSTGRVWEYDKAARAFVFLPMKPAAEHEKIAEIILEKNLSAITSRYNEEVLSTIPPRARAAQLAVFEKSYIDPLRSSIRSRKRKQ